MIETLGFAYEPGEWADPIELSFARRKDHQRTVSYECEDLRKFRFYVPRHHLGIEPGREAPAQIGVALAALPRPKRTIGFHSEEVRPESDGSFLVWELDRVQGQVIRYRLEHDGQLYVLHVPKQLFRTASWPRYVATEVLVASDDDECRVVGSGGNYV